MRPFQKASASATTIVNTPATIPKFAPSDFTFEAEEVGDNFCLFSVNFRAMLFPNIPVIMAIAPKTITPTVDPTKTKITATNPETSEIAPEIWTFASPLGIVLTTESGG